MSETFATGAHEEELASTDLDFDLREILRDRLGTSNQSLLDKIIGELESIALEAQENALPLDLLQSKANAVLLRYSKVLKETRKYKIYSKHLRAVTSKLFNKILLKRSFRKLNIRANSGLFITLFKKLKPTADGKDASIDNKAANKIQRFFINLWNQEHVQSQNRAFA